MSLIKIWSTVIFLGFFGVARSASVTSNELEEIFRKFDSTKFERKTAVIGKVTDFKLHVYSRMYSDIERVTIEVTKILGESRSGQGKKIDCKLPDSSTMIAPFEESTLDKTRSLRVNEEVFLLIGKNMKDCSIVHLSRISKGIILLPDWQKWKNEKVAVEEVKDLAAKMLSSEEKKATIKNSK
jgi:hypothetical protein